jgi:NAD(P)-dependent dehydrogenase (short-subunit alcohol dehydrogenase family)
MVGPGHRLMLTDVCAQRLDDLVTELASPDVRSLPADVRNADDIAGVVADTVTTWGQLDAVAHTAGGDLREWRSILDYPTQTWDACLDLNLTGSFNVIQAAGRAIAAQSTGGHIALVGSGSGLRPTAGNVGYTASKAGMIGLMRSAATELAQFGVRVNLVLPGLTLHRGIHLRDDPERGIVPLDAKYEAAIEKYKGQTVLGYLSTPEDFAHNMAHLLSTAAISGQIINFDSKIYY